ncbi:MAG: DUF4296 domain-containing protein [Bacteroidales bacterium]|nr:DUF4296 domain-containing protein [Candidatus Physcousia equi]
MSNCCIPKRGIPTASVLPPVGRRLAALPFSLLASVLLPLFLLACKPGAPSGVLPEAEMEELLYEYHIAQSVGEQDRKDVDRARYLNVQSVFEKHGITEAEFDSSMVWYASHADVLQRMYGRIIARLEGEATQMGVGVSETEVYANLSQTGDTANIWAGPSILYLPNDRLHNLVTITMSADSTFLPGDDFKLSFSTHFITNSQQEAYAFLSVFYTDGSCKAAHQRIGANYDALISLPSDINHNDRRAQRIVITFYRPVDRYASDATYFFLTQPALLRIHKKQEPATPAEDGSSDAVAQDSLSSATDSLAAVSDSAKSLPDLPRLAPSEKRLSPTEKRDSRKVERTVNIVKEKPIQRRLMRRRR